MEEYFGVAKDEGVSSEELGAVQAIVMAVSAGRVGAQAAEVRRRAAQKAKEGGTGDGS
jgi:hypothetical protein